jgi:hypothetical protein
MLVATMRVLLVANREPYLSFAGALGASPFHGEIDLSVATSQDSWCDLPYDLTVIPAELLLAIDAADRPQPSIAYGPGTLLPVCLSSGCIDYLVEPWAIPELAGRIKKCRPAGISLAGTVIFLDGGKLSSTVHAAVMLSPAEGALFRALRARLGYPVPRRILATLAGLADATLSRSLDVLVARLRAKVERAAPGSARFLRAMRKQGYVLYADDNQPVDNSWTVGG